MEKGSIKQSNKPMKYNRGSCDCCKNDIHRASYIGHSKSKKHLEKTQQNDLVIPGKSPKKRVTKERNKLPGTKIENSY